MNTTEDLATPVPSDTGTRRRRRWSVAGVLAGAALLVAAVLAAVAGDDGDEVATDTTAATTTTTATPTTTGPATASTTLPVVDRSTAVWPVPGSGAAHDDPVEAARGFAVGFLGFTAPHIGAFEPGDSLSGEVEVRPSADGPVTTVLLRRLGGEEAWSVLGAATAGIEITRPGAGEEISSPVRVEGRALAFEGHVDVEVRRDGRTDPAGTGFVTGGGDDLRPFAGDIAVAAGQGGPGALVFLTRSAEDGRVWEAAVLRVRLRPGELDPARCGPYHSPRYATGPDQMEVKVFFNCDRDGDGGVSLHPAYRVAPRSPALLRSALEALLRGPDADERQAAIGSWFSESTVPMLRSVAIDGGHAVVDFADLRSVIPNASASAGSRRLLSQLDATVFQFGTVRSVEYRLVGSCEAFNEWLQFGGCPPRTRSTSAAE